MKITVSRLRQDIFNILDSVLKTGVPVFINRKGKTLKITVEEPVDKLERLRKMPKRDIICDDPDYLIHIDWSSEWNSRI